MQYAQVYDLLNCGPRRRFVVRGADGRPLIVHNCENVTQATAHDILRGSLRRMDTENIEVVAHIHDEIVAECDEGDAERISARMFEIMVEPPAWAAGLPLGAEGAIMARYGKG